MREPRELCTRKVCNTNEMGGKAQEREEWRIGEAEREKEH
jgi:hypothetical protein